MLLLTFNIVDSHFHRCRRRLFYTVVIAMAEQLPIIRIGMSVMPFKKGRCGQNRDVPFNSPKS